MNLYGYVLKSFMLFVVMMYSGSLSSSINHSTGQQMKNGFYCQFRKK